MEKKERKDILCYQERKVEERCSELYLKEWVWVHKVKLKKSDHAET